ncbi:hypothetical protein QYG89_14595 [Bacillus sp. B190/17]|uniref:HEAT repeat domain-containing protein n=1 Tax=Bacillus lumedeiriae TaxID=3058829 RepID=A0ABW8IDY6_9BACI
MIDNRIWITIWAIAFLLFVLVMVFIYIAVQRMRQNRMNEKIQQYIKKYSEDWYSYLIEGGDSKGISTIKAAYERNAIDQILIRYAKNISGEHTLRRISDFAEHYLQDYYRDMLNSNSWSIRMNALNKILDLRLGFLLDDILKMLKREKSYSDQEYLVMYKILSVFKDDYFIYHLLHPKCTLSEFEYKRILYTADLNHLKELVRKLEDLPRTLQYVVIDMIGIRRYVEYIPFLEGLLVSDDREQRIRVLKSIGLIGYITNIDKYVPFVESSVWEERLMAAKLLRHVHLSQSSPYLERLIKDSSWWVRKQAADTLISQKMGEKVLELVILSGNDRYAVDIAKEVLGKE